MARGDSRAFEALYDELSSAVFGLARRVVRDPARAEDVTQEVFLEVWRKAARFDSALGKAKTWVMTIAHRRAVDAVRRNESQKRQDVKSMPDEVSHDEPADTLIAAEEHGAVRECMETLTDLQLESVRLAYFNGYTYSEVATSARQAASHHQDENEGRTDPSPRLPGGATMSTDLHTLSGAYAVDALSAEEAQAFATHLEECQACRDEVRELQEAAARMGASEALAAAARPQGPRPGRRRPACRSCRRKVTPARRRPASRRWTARVLSAAAAVVLVVGRPAFAVSQRRRRPVEHRRLDRAQVFAAAGRAHQDGGHRPRRR